jgi:hypothetical protein
MPRQPIQLPRVSWDLSFTKSASSFSGLANSNVDVKQATLRQRMEVNTYTMANAGGSATPVSNKTKYSTYILHELPHVGLNRG